MHLDDLDVVRGTERSRRVLDKLEQDIDADAHVWRVDDGNRCGAGGKLFLLRGVEPRGADHGADTMTDAGGDMGEGARGPREIDHDVGRAHRRIDVRLRDSTGRAPESFAGIVPNERAT